MVAVLMVSMVTGTREAFQIHHTHPKPLQADLQDNVEMQQLSVVVAPPPDVSLPGEWRHSDLQEVSFLSDASLVY